MSDSELSPILLDSIRFRFRNLKELGDGALRQVSEEEMKRAPGPDQNSIGVVIQHLHGNMMSRWVDFLTTDGEKTTRDRDGEFEPDESLSRDDLLRLWEEGWAAVFGAVDPLQPEDLTREITIRGAGLSAIDAINRQLTHYGYHVGQIVLLARMARGEAWQTLSIARGKSQAYKPRGRD